MRFYGDIDVFNNLVKGIKVGDVALKKAAVSACNKTATTVRAKAVKEISKEYKLTQKEIRSHLSIRKATFNRIESRVTGKGSPGVLLYKFAPTPKKAPSTRRLKSGGYSNKGGIKVMVRRGQRKQVKDAFVARMPSGHVGVFRRKDRGRGAWWNAFNKNTGIEELYGPSPLRILESDKYQVLLDDFTQETFDKNMAHEADFFMKKLGVLSD